MIHRIREEFGLSDSFYERMVYVYFVSACLELFPPEFLKSELMEVFLSYCQDKAIAIKILFLEVVPQMKMLAVCD